MRTFAFCEILCGIIKQSRFRLVHEINWNSRRLLYYLTSKETSKIQIPEVKFSLAPTWYHSRLFCTYQGSNITVMPKIELEKSRESKRKAKKTHNKLKCSRSSPLKHLKKKKKKHHHHHHKRKHSKKHSSEKKASRKRKPELVLLDSSSDSDIVIVYDSRTKRAKICDSGNSSQLNLPENSVKVEEKHCGGKEENDNLEEMNEKLILYQECEQTSSLQQTPESTFTSKEEHNCTISEPIPSDDGISCTQKSDQDVSGPSGIQEVKCKYNDDRWEFTSFSATMSDETKDSTSHERKYLMFNLLSYNVLCQEILEDHMDLYGSHNPLALDWEYRSKVLMKEFLEFDSDVMCLQEVQESHLKSFYNELQLIGYTGLFKQRTGDKKDGVAIYFRNSTFELIDYTTVEYYQPGVSVLNRDNVGLIVKLAPKMKPDERIVVATTHLLYNPRRHDVKLAQVQLLLAEVERFAFKGIDERTRATKYWPVILTGDMNFEPNTGGFQLLNKGCFRYDGLCSKTLTTNYYGYGQILGKELIPSYLGVTDTCQHWTILVQRTEQSTTEIVERPTDDHKTEVKLLQIYNSDFKKLQSPNSVNLEQCQTKAFYQKDYLRRFGSGKLKHPLELSSVYKFDPKENPTESQVSTFQNGWVVVDYIFYSNNRNPDDTTSQEGNLKLVARYKLLNADEADRIGPIPNLSSPSDHYPLAAKFALIF